MARPCLECVLLNQLEAAAVAHVRDAPHVRDKPTIIVRHVVQRTLNPLFLRYNASCDVVCTPVLPAKSSGAYASSLLEISGNPRRGDQ